MVEPKPLHLVSYNMQDGGEDRLDLIRNVIARQRPDVVAVQEATNRKILTTLGHRLGMEVVFGTANNGFHLAWLSRLPIRQSHNHPSPLLARTLLEIQVEWNGETVCLFTTHLASRHDAQSPSEEASVIVQLLAPYTRQPLILTGDFNALGENDPVGTSPPGTILRGEAIEGAPRTTIPTLVASGYIDCFRAIHPTSPGFTYPAAAPWLRLDYIFTSPDLATRLMSCDVLSKRTIWKLNSLL